LWKPLPTIPDLTGGLLSFATFDIITTMIMMNVPLNVRPAIVFYRELRPLLRAMRAGLISFAIGYGFTIFLFAGFYAALYKYNADFFPTPQGRQPPLQLWDFIYFSVTTITTVGLSDVKPATDLFWPQAFVSAELIAGIFWIVIYFAVAMTLLQAYVSDLLARLAKSSPPRS
jgi:Ion channel